MVAGYLGSLGRIMEYRLGADYLRMRNNGPRRAVLMVLCVALLLALMTFVPSYTPPIKETLPPFLITFAIIGAITLFQITHIRRGLRILPEIRYRIDANGITFVYPSAHQVLEFDGIRKITVVRGRWNGRISKVVLNAALGDIPVVGLDNFDQFIREASEHRRDLEIRETRTWWS